MRAALVTSAIFVAWHLVVQVRTLAVTNLTSPWLVVPAMGLAFGDYSPADSYSPSYVCARTIWPGRSWCTGLFDAAFVPGRDFLTTR